MASVNVLRDSFNAGELAPTIGARFGVEKVASGCRVMRNFYPHVHGPALRRPGMKYLGDSVASVSLRPFTFSATTGAMLEFSPNGLGVWQDGERVPINPVDLPYDEEDCMELQIVQVNDVCYIAHKNHPPKKLVRWSDTDWRISDLVFKWPPLGDENFRSDEVATPTVAAVFTEACPAATAAGATYALAANTDWRAEFIAPGGMTGRVIVQVFISGAWKDEMELTIAAGTTTIRRGRKFNAARNIRFRYIGAGMSGTATFKTLAYPLATAITLACAATSGTGLALTASQAIFTAKHVGAFWQITHARTDAHAAIVAAVPTIAVANSTAIKVVGAWSVNTYGSWNTTLYLEKQIGGVWETVRSYSARSDRNIVDSGNEDTPVMMRLRVVAGTSVAVTSGAGQTGAAVPRFVLENREARISGLVKITTVGALNAEGKATTATCDVTSELHATTATTLWTEGAFSQERGYPRSITLHGGRLWFGGTEKEPQRVWGSVVNDFENFRRSTYDDASLSLTPASQSSNAINWLASYAEYLVMGTTVDEWTITGSTGFITPLDFSVRRRSGYGSAYLPAFFFGESLIFVGRDERHLRQVVPRTSSGSEEWSAVNLNTLADHLIAPQEGIAQFAIQNSPVSILWAVLTDGKLLGLTFERDQNVFAWHRHDLAQSTRPGSGGGNNSLAKSFIQSVGVLPSKKSDHVYFHVRHLSGFSTIVQSYAVERFQNEVFERDWNDAAYLDSYVNAGAGTSLTQVDGLLRMANRVPVVLNRNTWEIVPNANAVSDAGILTIALPAGSYRIGTPFVSQLQMMRFDVPLRDGTSQGRNWKTSRVRVRMIASRGGTIADSLDFGATKEAIPSSATPADSEREIAIRSTTREGCDVVIETSEPYPLNVQSIVWKGDISGE